MKYFLLVLSVVTVYVLSGCAPKTDLRDNPNAEVHYNMGVSYLKEPNPSLALESFLEAERLAPRDPKIHDALAGPDLYAQDGLRQGRRTLQTGPGAERQ